MSRQRWEYLTLTWMHSVSGSEGALQYQSTWLIREGHSGVDTPRSADDALVDVLADLGAQGWELVNETIQSSTPMNRQGFPNSSTPLRVRWILKRPADDEG
jgi:hypothetical protein